LHTVTPGDIATRSSVRSGRICLIAVPAADFLAAIWTVYLHQAISGTVVENWLTHSETN
jgi:hypothetical protein